MMLDRIRAYIALTKPRVSALLTMGGAAGGFLAYSTSTISNILLGIIAVFIASCGINSITNYIDRDIDAIMKRTRKRPLPAGKINPPTKAIYFGIILVIISILILAMISIYAIFWILFGVLFDPLLYNYYTKRKTYWNIIIGSFAGGAPVFVVWSSATGSFFGIDPFLVFLLIVLWTPIHIWSLSLRYLSDYVRAKVPMLPVKTSAKFTIRVIATFSIILFIISMILYILLNLHPWTIAVLGLINLVLLVPSIALLFKPDEKKAYLLFKLTSPYLFLVFLVVILHGVL